MTTSSRLGHTQYGHYQYGGTANPDDWRVELDNGTQSLALSSSAITNPRIELEPSSIGAWSLTIPDSPNITDWLFSTVRLYYDSQLVMRGRLLKTEGKDPTLSGPDTIHELTHGGASVTYNNIKAVDAIQDYWTNHTSWSATVHEPTPDVIDTGLIVQDTTTGGDSL